jgi:hypothetical protein
MAAADQDDDELLHRLRRLVSDADPVPDTVLAAARAAIETRDLDAGLARLIADSAQPTDRAGLATVRSGGAGAAAERMLLYEGDGLRIDLSVQPHAGLLTVVGRLVGAGTGGCRLERPDSRPRPVELDEWGRFVVTGLVPGPVRVRCRSAAGAPVVSEWVNL